MGIKDSMLRFPRLPKLRKVDGDPEERLDRIEAYLEELLTGIDQYGTSIANYLGQWERARCGVYTPTLTNTTNVGASTAYECQWLRMGTSIVVSGKVDITPTAAAPTATLLGISLPLDSNIAAEQDCMGVGNCYTVAAAQGGAIVGDAANNRASYRFAAISNAAHSHGFIFLYELLN